LKDLKGRIGLAHSLHVFNLHVFPEDKKPAQHQIRLTGFLETRRREGIGGPSVASLASKVQGLARGSFTDD